MKIIVNHQLREKEMLRSKTIKRRQAPSQINILKEKLTGMDNDDEDLATFDPLLYPHQRVLTEQKDPIEDVPVQPHSKSMFSDGPVQRGFSKSAIFSK